MYAKPKHVVLLGLLSLVAALMALMLSGTAGTAATQPAPENTEPPTISGTPQVGSTLTADEGKWKPNPTDYDYAWRRCDADGGSCTLISGAGEKTYVLKQADQDKTIRVVVTAQNAAGRATATSAPTAVIRAAATPPPPAAGTGCNRAATVMANELKAPERLSISGQQVSPSVIGGSTRTIVARFRITACNGKPVQGALVYVTAVPFSQFSIPPEAQTGADGWAELRMNRARFFPASTRQQLLVMFVRAREPGGNLLGGISTRRLVSFPVNLNR